MKFLYPTWTLRREGAVTLANQDASNTLSLLKHETKGRSQQSAVSSQQSAVSSQQSAVSSQQSAVSSQQSKRV